MKSSIPWVYPCSSKHCNAHVDAWTQLKDEQIFLELLVGLKLHPKHTHLTKNRGTELTFPASAGQAGHA